MAKKKRKVRTDSQGCFLAGGAIEAAASEVKSAMSSVIDGVSHRALDHLRVVQHDLNRVPSVKGEPRAKELRKRARSIQAQIRRVAKDEGIPQNKRRDISIRLSRMWHSTFDFAGSYVGRYCRSPKAFVQLKGRKP
jgi:hypothetical protein